MTRLLVLCPSYRRPIAAGAVRDTFRRATLNPDTQLTFLLYQRDPDSGAYSGGGMDVVLCPEPDMVARVNGALGLLEDFTHVGWIADDNRFSTRGWDERVLAALEKSPIVFCNDVVSPGAKPSHVFMDARIPMALGWFLLPGIHSTFFDDAWETLGTGLSGGDPLFPDGKSGVKAPGAGLGIAYLADIRINHLYIEKDNSAWFQKDMGVYRAWLRHGAEADIARARSALRPRRDAGGPEGRSLAGAQRGAG